MIEVVLIMIIFVSVCTNSVLVVSIGYLKVVKLYSLC